MTEQDKQTQVQSVMAQANTTHNAYMDRTQIFPAAVSPQ